MTSLKDRLSKSMEAVGAKQADLARQCGISRSAVSNWFTRPDSGIAAEHIFPLARLLLVDPEWLATGQGEAKRAKGRAPVWPFSFSMSRLENLSATQRQEIDKTLEMLIVGYENNDNGGQQKKAS